MFEEVCPYDEIAFLEAVDSRWRVNVSISLAEEGTGHFDGEGGPTINCRAWGGILVDGMLRGLKSPIPGAGVGLCS